MNALLETHRTKLAEVCQQFGVERLEVFGSAARDDFQPNASDFDFIVRFRAPDRPGYADRYLGFAEALERLLGRRVDLLTERSLRNPVFIASIAADRQPVYAA